MPDPGLALRAEHPEPTRSAAAALLNLITCHMERTWTAAQDRARFTEPNALEEAA